MVTFKKIILSLVILFLLFSLPKSTKAMAMMPFFDITVNEHTDFSDGNFSFHLTGFNSYNNSDFNIQTASSSGSYSTEIAVGIGERYSITEDAITGWENANITCTSTNPLVTASSTLGGVQINVDPYSSITCDFTNKKVRHNPVIIIPGILSSYLNKEDGTEVWPNVLKALIPGSDSYLDDLILSSDGVTSSTTIKTSDIMRETKIPPVADVDFFQGLITKLNEQYTEGEDLFVFPYDWRLDVDSVAREKLSLFIENVLAQSGSKKIDIIAHSMGGLVTKSYIKNFGAEKIGKFIDIATPHLGSPDSLKILSYGDDLGVNFWGAIGLNIDEIKKISQNFPSVYELLPSEKYFDSNDPDYKYYFNDLADADGNNVKGKLDFSQTGDFLKKSGRNSLLVDQAKDYQDGIANVDPQASGIETINIVGCGTPTIGKIFTLDKKNSKNEYALAYINGDGTVPLKSAQALNTEKTYYVSGGIKHGTMPSSSGVKDLVSSILFRKDPVLDSNVSSTTTSCKLPNGKYVSVHSPVNIDIYDTSGNHSGLNKNGDIEQNIPGVIFDTVEDNKFVFIPDGENYKVNFQATDLGSFSIDIKTEKDGIDHFDYFNNIPINSINLSGIIDISSSTPALVIKEDKNSNDKILLPNVSSSVDLNENPAEPPIVVSTTTPISVQNTMQHHSQGRVQLFSYQANTSTQTFSPLITKVTSYPEITSSKVLPKAEQNISSNTNKTKIDDSNTASALNGIKGLNIWQKILHYKNIVWSFVSRMFHFTK